MPKFKFTTNFIARTGIIAGLYAVISFIAMPIASGLIQVRISEALCLLPLFFPESILGLFVGCLVSNLITGCAFLDVLFGSLITLSSAFLTYYIGKLAIKRNFVKILIGGLFPIILNALLLPIIWHISYGYSEYAYPLQVLFLLAGQSLSIYGVGTPLYFAVKSMKVKSSVK